MRYREYKPSRQFSRLVRAYWTLSGKQEQGSELEPIVPDGCPEIVFNLGERFSRLHSDGLRKQPRSIVVGQMNSRVDLVAAEKIRLFGVRFEPHALCEFIRDDARVMTDHIEDIVAVLGRDGARLEEKIRLAATPAGMAAAFEAAFIELGQVSIPQHDTCDLAIGLMEQEAGSLRIAALSRRLGVSIKKLERDFAKRVGLNPKSFGRILRIQSALRAIETDLPQGFAGVAYDCGFSDQSHFIREFKRFTGETPAEFVSKKRKLTEVFCR